MTLQRRIHVALASFAAALAAFAAMHSTLAAAATVQAKGADAFVESIGVNTHLSYTDTPYTEAFPTIEQRLGELGVHHIRDGLVAERPDEYQRLDELAGMGIKSTLIMGDPGIGSSGLAGLVATLKGPVRPSVEAVEGPNEYDTRGGAGWSTALAAYQSQLYTAIKSDPTLASLPVVGPSIVQKRNAEALGDISGSLDFGNVHSYPLTAAPEGNVASYRERAALNSGSKPIMATETGYHNAMGWTGEQAPVSEEAAATYMPRLFLEYFNQGITRTFAYELADEANEPNVREANWGLLHNDLSPKPAFTALKNLIAITADPGGAALAPGDLDYSVGGDTSNLHQVLLEKSDGSYYLALWRADSVWDAASRAPVAVAPTPVSLGFDRQVVSAERFEPNVAATSLGPVAQSDGTLGVNVGANVVIVRVVVGKATAGRISFWVGRHSLPAGASVSVGGRLPRGAAGVRQAVNIQRLSPTGDWRTVGHGKSLADGRFRKAIRIPSRFGSAPRLRVVAASATPSKPVRLRIRGARPVARTALAAATVAG